MNAVLFSGWELLAVGVLCLLIGVLLLPLVRGAIGLLMLLLMAAVWRRAKRGRLDVSRLSAAVLVAAALWLSGGGAMAEPSLSGGFTEGESPMSGEFFFACVLGFALGLWLFGCWASRRHDRRLWEISLRLAGGLEQPLPTIANGREAASQPPQTLVQGVDPL